MSCKKKRPYVSAFAVMTDLLHGFVNGSCSLRKKKLWIVTETLDGDPVTIQHDLHERPPPQPSTVEGLRSAMATTDGAPPATERRPRDEEEGDVSADTGGRRLAAPLLLDHTHDRPRTKRRPFTAGAEGFQAPSETERAERLAGELASLKAEMEAANAAHQAFAADVQRNMAEKQVLGEEQRKLEARMREKLTAEKAFVDRILKKLVSEKKTLTAEGAELAARVERLRTANKEVGVMLASRNQSLRFANETLAKLQGEVALLREVSSTHEP